MNTIAEFEDILETILMTDEEKDIFRMIYKEKRSISYIADIMGVSESVVKARHKRLLMKIGSYF